MAYISAAKKLEIEAQVSDLHAHLSEDVEKISLPIDLTKLLERFDLQLKETTYEDEDISGAYDKKDKTIWISSKDPYVRKVFTVAHELGHFVLHDDVSREILYRNQLVQIAKEKDPLEVEANFFAASLLMPKKLVRKYWKISKDIELLSKLFSVSNTAVYWRLKNLGLVA